MKKKHILFVLGILFLIAAIVIGMLAIPRLRAPQTEDFAPTTTAAFTATTIATQPLTGTTSAPIPQPYVSPVDFKGLQAINPDVYAWITVPGTNVNYPIVQSPDNDSFYLDHDSDKNYDRAGAIFTEHVYNDTDFRDKVTVLYGHDMANGSMFGELQSLYWDREFLLENDEIIIYLPDRELHFEIFAALPYSRMHLLYYYHTEKEKAFDQLIDDVYSTRKLSAVLIEERRPEFGDQVVVLSTCLSGDNRYRYLVMGVCKTVSDE